MSDTVRFTLDGKEVDARKGEWVIAAAERVGVYIPRFCYHPRMRPVGMCRMCLVEIDAGRGPALQIACTVPVADGMTVVTDSPAVKKAQEGVLEFLLINHPLDCPVCDKGGECPLQDQTLAYGPGESRFVEEKRHFAKPIAISRLVHLDRERCVLCDRCTRFADEVAGDPLIHFLDRGSATQVNTYPDQPFSSYFSGNTVEICPVGALLATPYRFRARPWDLEQVESTCTSCSVGCRVAVQSSTNRLVRYLGVDVDPVNHGWLCDKGRFDFEALNSEHRLGQPLLRRPGAELEPVGWAHALGAAADGLRAARDGHGPGSVAVIGGARLTNEEAYAWAKLAKGVLGTDSVDCQLGDGLPAEVVLGLPRATIDDACAASTLVLLGADVKEELPVLFLRLRDAVVWRGLQVLELAPHDTAMTALAKESLRYLPGTVHERVRSLLDDRHPLLDGREGGEGSTAPGGDGAPAPGEEAGLGPRRGEGTAPGGDGAPAPGEEAGLGPRRGEGIVVLLGRASLAEAPDSVAAAAAALHRALPGARFLSGLRRSNVHGALDMGLAPGLLPGRVSLDEGREWFTRAWGSVPAERGLDTTGILRAAADGRVRALVLLGADPLADFPDRDLARRALAGAGFVVAVDGFLTDSSRQADVVVPAALYAEKAGTTTNLEGRVSRLNQKVTAPGTAREDWIIAAELAFRLGADLGVESVDGLWDEIERLAPSHAGLTPSVMRSAAGLDGVVVPLAGAPTPAAAPPAMAQTDQPGVVAAGVHSHLAPEAVATTAPGGPGAVPAAERGSESAGAPEDLAEAQAAAGQEAAYGGEEGDEAALAASSRATTEAAAPPDAAAPPPGPSEGGPADPARPPLLRAAPVTTGTPHPPDNYSLRLVSNRKLYDRGTLVAHSPSLAPLAPGAALRAHPSELDRHGVRTGQRVRVVARRGSLLLPVEADPGVPRGRAVLWFNQPGGAAADVIDATAAVTDVRLETVGEER